MTNFDLFAEAYWGRQFPELTAVAYELLGAAEDAGGAAPFAQPPAAPDPGGVLPVAAIANAQRVLHGGTLSKRTRELYAYELSRLHVWLDDHGVSDFDDRYLVLYLAHLYQSGKSASSANLARSAVNYVAKSGRQASPAGRYTNRVLVGYRHRARHRGRGPVKPVTWKEAERAAEKAADGSAMGARDAALICTLSDSMLPASKAAALRVRDLQFRGDGSARVRVPAPDGKPQRLHYLGPPTARRIENWLAWPHRGSSAPLFPRLDKKHCPVGRISRQGINGIVRERFRAIGLVNVVPQSLRAGGARSLAMEGASIAEIQHEGGWRSPTMPARYARPERGAVARLRYGRTRKDE